MAMVGAFFSVLPETLSAALGAAVRRARFGVRALRGRRVLARSRIRRFVILGIDGMDYALTHKLLAENKLPHLARLQQQGCFLKLATTIPPISPVAWSSFQTGSNPGKHNIFDFLTRDKKTYLPRLSSVEVADANGHVPPGDRRRGPDGAAVRLLRKGRPFWATLAEHGIFSSIIRVPITFPPEELHGVQLSGMCVPDLRGTQGAFSFYTTESLEQRICVAGERFVVTRDANTVAAELTVPANPFHRNGQTLKCPFHLTIVDEHTVTLNVRGNACTFPVGEYSPWIALEFAGGPPVRGIARFLVLSVTPEFQLYVTPINIDPQRPVVPISYPPAYCAHLAKRQGLFATLGQSEDTWALNEGVLTDDAFIRQCLDTTAEREKMFLDSLDRVKRGLCVCVFDGLDRVQHAFWRDLEGPHAAAPPQAGSNGAHNAIERLYQRMDRLAGTVLDKCRDQDTVLMVISDHGFTGFRYGVDLNRWLEENGYLKLRRRGRYKRGLIGIDWSETRAFALGLTGVFLNLKGREARGIVEPGAEADRLGEEIAAGLLRLTDPERGGRGVVRHVYPASKIYHGPYRNEAPDLIVGFEEDYRMSWANTMGQVTDRVFHENTKAWSGDHCVDHSLVPGVLFCNRRVGAESPSLLDIGPTVLAMFGLPVPQHMDGAPLAVAEPELP